MPELAEVEYYRKCWDPGIGNRVLEVRTHSTARVYRDMPAAAVSRALEGRDLKGSEAHGKRMLFAFSGGAWLGVHLGMTGKLLIAERDHDPLKADHLVLVQENQSLIFRDPRMFGKLDLEMTGGESLPPAWWIGLPPRPLDRDFTKDFVAEFTRRFPKTPIKTILLDQRGFPGIGNWMADEICWQMKLDPRTPTGNLDAERLAELWKIVRFVSRGAMKTIAVDWSDPPRSWLFKNRWKDGQRCPRLGCGTELVRADLRGRTTCWCPQCQEVRG